MSSFKVSVFCDKGVWCGVNDDLPFAAEGDSLEQLMARVREIGPEMAVLNGLAEREEDVTLDFVMVPAPTDDVEYGMSI
jgi:hypothetical protein